MADIIKNHDFGETDIDLLFYNTKYNERLSSESTEKDYIWILGAIGITGLYLIIHQRSFFLGICSFAIMLTGYALATLISTLIFKVSYF